MAHPRPSQRRRSTLALVAASALIFPVAIASPAMAADDLPVGLFGTQSPEFDGVYRQSLALLAFAAEGVEPPTEAVEWLLEQQCDSGAFEAFRANPSTSCAAPDPDAFTGPDTNATAMAAQALAALGEDDAAFAALDYLADAQNDDGGIPSIKGGLSDANSTGVTAMAVSALGGSLDETEGPGGNTLADALDGLQVDCTGEVSEHGAYAFRADFGIVANDYATVQALLGRAGGFLPVLPDSPADIDALRLDCGDGGTDDPAAAGAGYLADRLSDNGGTIPDAFNPGATDWGSTRNAVIALAGVGLGREALVDAWTELDAQQDTFLTDAEGDDLPGALAEMILATNAAAPSLTAGDLDVTRVERAVVVGDTDTSELLTRLESTLNAEPTVDDTDGTDGTDGEDKSASPIPPTDATNGGTEIADTGATSVPVAVSGALLLVLGAALVAVARRFALDVETA
jgi:hypothetical protein